jgi:hypothetical protein
MLLAEKHQLLLLDNSKTQPPGSALSPHKSETDYTFKMDMKASRGEVNNFQGKIMVEVAIKPIETTKATLGRRKEAHSKEIIMVEEAASTLQDLWDLTLSNASNVELQGI